MAEEGGELFRVAFELAVDGMLITDPDGKYLTANPRISELTGYSRAELVGMKVDDLLAVEQASGSLRRQALSIASSASERSIRRKDGKVFPGEVSGRILPGNKILWTLRDISERKRAEESLAISERRYRALVESQIDLVSRYRADTILTYVNDAYCKFYGRKREELIGQSFMFMVAPEYRDIVARETAELAKDPAALVVGEYVNVMPAGHERWIQWIIQSITDENHRVLELQAVGRDITQLKLTQEALRQANIVVESSPAVLFRWKASAGWPVVFVSKNITQFGYSADELLSGGARYASLVHPEDRERLAREVQTYAKDNVDRFQQEYRILTKDGDVRWVDDRTSVARDDQGQVLYFQGILLDITERKRAEADKQKLQRQLNQAQKMESVGRLAGGVAHDFNNMLTAILGHTQLAMMNVTPAAPLHQDLSMIEQVVLRSAEIVKQLLAFARKQTIAPRVLDLNDTVTGMLKMLRRLIGEDIDFAWMPGSRLWPVRIDPSQVDQLLANLCVNARDAIEGVGKITIESENAVFDQDYCAAHPGAVPGDYVMLAVSDDGCGMDKETLAHVFEPFFTTKEVGKGTGLGLATVYGIVKQNDGFVSATSELGRGTTFKMYFPRSLEAPSEQGAASAVEMPRGQGETVLLVEDEESILKITKAMLEVLGYRVLAAGTPGDALRAARADVGTIALLLTDIIMPEMNGRDLATAITAIQPGTKCLYTSGYTADAIAHRGVLDEDVAFLQKPFTVKNLALRVYEALHPRK